MPRKLIVFREFSRFVAINNSMNTCRQKNEPHVPANFVDAARLLAAAVERLISLGIEPWKISR